MGSTDTISLLDGTKYELLPQASMSRMGLKLPQAKALAAVKKFTDENLVHIVIRTNGGVSGEYEITCGLRQSCFFRKIRNTAISVWREKRIE